MKALVCPVCGEQLCFVTRNVVESYHVIRSVDGGYDIYESDSDVIDDCAYWPRMVCSNEKCSYKFCLNYNLSPGIAKAKYTWEDYINDHPELVKEC